MFWDVESQESFPTEIFAINKRIFQSNPETFFQFHHDFSNDFCFSDLVPWVLRKI